MKNKIYIKIFLILLLSLFLPLTALDTAAANPITSFFQAANFVAENIVKSFSASNDKKITGASDIGIKLSDEKIKKALADNLDLSALKLDEREINALKLVSGENGPLSSESVVLKKKLDLLEKLYDEKFASAVEAASDTSNPEKSPNASLNKTLTVDSQLPDLDTVSINAKSSVTKSGSELLAKLKNQKANSSQFKELLEKFKEDANPQTKSYIEFVTSAENSKKILPPNFQMKGGSGLKVYENRLEDKQIANKSFSYDSSKKSSASSEKAAPEALQKKLSSDKQKAAEQEQKKPTWKKPSLSIDFYRNEITKTIGPQIKAGAEGSFRVGGAVISGAANGEVLIGVEAKGATYAGIRNGQLAAGVEGSVFAGERVRGNASAGMQMGQVAGKVFASGEASVGAGANGDAHVGLGKGSAEAVVSGDAFVGVRGKVSTGVTLSHGNTSVTASANATGGIGLGAHFEAKGKISWTGIQAKVDIGAYLGIGGQLGFDVNINFGDALKPVQKVVEKVYDKGKEIVNGVKDKIASAGKSLANFFNW